MIKTLGLGGAETNLLNLVGATDAGRFEPHVGYSHGGPVENRFLEAGAKLFKYSEGDHKIKSAATFTIVARMVSYVRKHGIGIIHTHNFNAHVWGAVAAKLSGAKLVEHVHDFRYLEPEEYLRRHGNVAQFRYIRHFKGWSDAVVVLTRQNKDFLERNRYYPAERVHEIPNGIPDGVSQAASGLREKLGIPSGAAIVLTPARIAEEKNIPLVLDIALQVAAHFPGVCFVVAGDGPLLEQMKSRAAREGLERTVKFIGYFNDVEALLSIAEVFLLPSFLELHSISILEAMKCGVPVVVSKDVGCNSEFIDDGVNGFLRDPFRREGWAEALAGLLRDEPLRRRIGEAGRRLCRERFDIRNTARRFEELYEKLLPAS